MGHAMAIMWREINARRELLWLALAVATMVMLLPFLPGLEGQTRADVWETASTFLCIGVGCLLAVGLGATTFGTDLAEGRLGFFFERPISAASVWLGRITGVLILVFVTELIILAPVAFIRPSNLQLLTRYGWWGLVPLVLAPALLVFLAHAMGVMVRARTAWLALDVVGFVSAAVAMFLVLRPLVRWGTRDAVWSVGLALIGATLVALALGGAAGVIFGRVDLRRTHGALSLGLWISLGVTVACAASYGHWVNDVGPRDLVDVWVESIDSTDTWAVIRGEAPSKFNIERKFLVSLRDGRYVTVLQPVMWVAWYQMAPVFSESGKVAAWFVVEKRDDPHTLWWVDLTADKPVPRETSITAGYVREFDLSPDGSRILVVTSNDGLVSVYNLADESLVSMNRLPDPFEGADCRFVNENSVRLWSPRVPSEEETSVVHLSELDIEAGEVVETGEIELSDQDEWQWANNYQSAILILSDCPGEDCRLRLHDPRTGKLEEVRRLPDWATGADILRDGRIVAWDRSDWTRTLAVALESSENGGWITHRFDKGPKVSLRGEILPAELMMMALVREPLGSTEREEIRLFNLETSETRQIGPANTGDGVLGELRGAYWSFWRSTFPVEWEPGVWHVLLNTSTGLFRWDPETDELVRVAGGKG